MADGIAIYLRPVPEDDTPSWLWRHVPDETALAALPDEERHRGENDLRQVIDRIAGGWTYHGWKGGYFDSEQDALAFFDEVRWLLWHRKFSPSMAQWRFSGLHWAYGLPAADDGFVVDYRSGAVRRATAEDMPPHGAFINGAHGSLAGDGGVWDLWRREAAILQRGGICGANVSDLDGTPAPANAARLVKLLALGEAAAETARGGGAESTPPRRITIDALHPGSRGAVRRGGAAVASDAAQLSGNVLTRRHIDFIVAACQESRARDATDPRGNPALRLAIQSARRAMLPDILIDHILDLIKQGEWDAAADLAREVPARAELAPDSATTTVCRADDAVLARASHPIDDAAVSAWMSGTVGLHFDTAVQKGNTCPGSGLIRSASGDGGFLFLDDTACDHAVINAAAQLRDDGSFDIEGLQHAASLATIALDISLMAAAQPTPRLARRVWDFRPLGLSLAGIGEVLMARGIAYDSEEGRATCGALCGLVTGAGYLSSARLAREMGPFPAWNPNAAAMQHVLRGHAEAAMSLTAAHPDLAAALHRIWNAALEEGGLHGYRNAQISHIADAAVECTLLGCATNGVGPLPSLTRLERLPAGGWHRMVEPAVIHGLRALGYGATEIDAMLRHVLGHGTLAQAPGVNHETLRRRGFTDSAIRVVEAALPTAFDITQAVSRWTLGDAYCRRTLGFSAQELADENFDMLAALGFSDAGVEAANLYCCGAGTLEGAPGLDPDHLAVFDCAAPQGERGRRQISPEGTIRMMAAAQPVVSGGVGHVVALPSTASIADCRAALRLGWRLGLKSLAIRRPSADAPAMFADREAAPAPRGATALSLIRGGGASAEAPSPNTGIDVAEHGGDASRDAETSRRPASQAARSTTSVPSSADVVVEQRQV